MSGFFFDISTVFQVFFVSYLVEPKCEKKLETLDDQLDSEVIYGTHSLVSIIQDILSYPELTKFVEHKRLQRC